MKKLKTLFKASPIAVIVVGILLVSVASAALLGVYVTVTGEATVEQAVVLGNGETAISESFTETAGNTYTQASSLENRSEVVAPIRFVTSYIPDGEGIDTSYWSTVELENKNSNWVVIPDDTRATLTYELASSTFNYVFEGKAPWANTEYSLIYYADKPDRFVNWDGSNPGALIATFTADENGDIPTTTGSIDLAMNLPTIPDWNATAEANYCNNIEGDDYNLCRGAKIWLVPSDDYSVTALTAWNPTSYLFETDLITYDDTDIDGEALNLGTGLLNFFIKNIFAVGMEEGTYTITTEIQPVQ